MSTLQASPPHALPALAWQDKIALLLIEKGYCHAARVDVIAHAECTGSVWCCPVFDPTDEGEADRAEVEALLPLSDEWVEGWVDWYVYGTTEPTDG